MPNKEHGQLNHDDRGCADTGVLAKLEILISRL